MNPLTFDECFNRLIGIEAGYSDDPNDPGNWTGGRVNVGALKGTKYGIAANTYPDLDIKNLSLDQAKAIYRRDWWDGIAAEGLDPVLVFQLWDFAINAGMARAVMGLQRAAGVSDDGILGSITEAAIKRLPLRDVLDLFNAERLEYYANRSTWPTHGKGWVRRVAKMLRYAAQDTVED